MRAASQTAIQRVIFGLVPAPLVLQNRSNGNPGRVVLQFLSRIVAHKWVCSRAAICVTLRLGRVSLTEDQIKLRAGLLPFKSACRDCNSTEISTLRSHGSCRSTVMKMLGITMTATLAITLAGWISPAAADPDKDESGKGRWRGGYERSYDGPGRRYGYGYERPQRERRAFKEDTTMAAASTSESWKRAANTRKR
jgi:hypothetical protein